MAKLNKTQLLAKLEELGVESPEEATNKELEALIEENKPEVTEEKTKEVKKEEKKTEFLVYNTAGKYIRTYSIELHGEKAGALAKQFADSSNCIIK